MASGKVYESFLCSIKPDAELFVIVVRRHWHIENGLHWTLDVVFREDRLRSKEKNGIHNLGLMCLIWDTGIMVLLFGSHRVILKSVDVQY